MPWVDDVLNGLEIQLDQLWYDILRLLAVAGWALQKGLFLMGHAIQCEAPFIDSVGIPPGHAAKERALRYVIIQVIKAKDHIGQCSVAVRHSH